MTANRKSRKALTPDQARKEAAGLAGAIANGSDPAAVRAAELLTSHLRECSFCLLSAFAFTNSAAWVLDRAPFELIAPKTLHCRWFPRQLEV
jgi:hypothetical protein